jgi:hypothetical protein
MSSAISRALVIAIAPASARQDRLVDLGQRVALAPIDRSHQQPVTMIGARWAMPTVAAPPLQVWTKSPPGSRRPRSPAAGHGLAGRPSPMRSRVVRTDARCSRSIRRRGGHEHASPLELVDRAVGAERWRASSTIR